jgi:hypothetical protein
LVNAAHFLRHQGEDIQIKRDSDPKLKWLFSTIDATLAISDYAAMKRNEKFIVGIIALFAGLIGGVSSRWVLPASGEKVQQVIAANEFLVVDKNSNGYAILGIDKGEPRLKFYGVDDKVRAYFGIEGDEPKLSLSRKDGSSTWIAANDDGPGWNFTLLKSLGEGKGVYMSMLTSDNLSIYQSKLGSIQIGNFNDKINLSLADADNKTIWKAP